MYTTSTTAEAHPTQRPPREAPTAIVVGAGAFGASTADALVRRGWAVTLVERYAPANGRGSSGDRTRLLRCGHGGGEADADDAYVRSAARGIAGWRSLSDEQDEPLVAPTGLVWLARDADGVEARVAERLARAGVAAERLTPRETQALFPSMHVDDLAFSLLEPDASVIRATAAVQALVRRARRGGARLVLDTARPSGPGAVTLSDGTVHAADRVVWACGPWLGALFPREAPVRPSWQDVLHWNAPPEWRAGPAWFDDHPDVYGFPDLDGLGIKAVSHRPGRTLDLEHDARVADPATVAALAAYVAHRFPALAGTGLLWSRVMPYEMTPDGHFVAGPAELDGHWLLGGGSGHGFKHAPSLGEHLADLLEGRAEVVPLFRPGPRGS